MIYRNFVIPWIWVNFAEATLTNIVIMCHLDGIIKNLPLDAFFVQIVQSLHEDTKNGQLYNRGYTPIKWKPNRQVLFHGIREVGVTAIFRPASTKLKRSETTKTLVSAYFQFQVNLKHLHFRPNWNGFEWRHRATFYPSWHQRKNTLHHPITSNSVLNMCYIHVN